MSRVLADQLDLADVHHLGDQLQVVRVGGAAQHLQALLAEALEAVGRAARLEGAAAQDLRAGALHRRGAGHHLLVGLGRARTGHDDHFVAAYPHVVDRDDRVLGLEGPAGALVGLGDAQHLVHAVEDPDQLRIDLVRTDDAEHRPRGARRSVHVHAQFDEARDDRVDLRLGGPFLHYDDHDITLRLLDSHAARLPRAPLAAPRRSPARKSAPPLPPSAGRPDPSPTS